MVNIIGQELSIGDVVQYLTGLGNPSWKGIITSFSFGKDEHTGNDITSPNIFTWNELNPNGEVVTLLDCDLVFKIPRTVEEVHAEILGMIDNQ